MIDGRDINSYLILICCQIRIERENPFNANVRDERGKKEGERRDEMALTRNCNNWTDTNSNSSIGLLSVPPPSFVARLTLTACMPASASFERR